MSPETLTSPWNGLIANHGSGLHAQHVPTNVWSKFFASHLTIGSALDGGATTSRDRADAACPLPYKLRLAPDGNSERCLSSRRVIDVFGEFHTGHLKRRAKDSQAERLLPQVSIALAIEGMETVGEIRRQNLELLVIERRTLDAVAVLAGSNSSVYLSQVRNRTLDTETKRPREMGGRMARRIEAGVGKPSGWMDTPHPELVAVGTTPEKTSTETQGAGVTEVTESSPMSPTDARDISPQSAPETEIPTFMSYNKPRLHSTILLLGSLLGALDETSRQLIAVILGKLTENPEDAADYAERAVANARVQKRLVVDDRLNKVLTTLSEGTTENGGLK